MALYKFLDESIPFIEKYNINKVTLALCGSVRDGKATCPRPAKKFCESAMYSIKFHEMEIEKENLDIREVLNKLKYACRVFKNTDDIIHYLNSNFPNTIIEDITREERCSDVDGYVVVPDEAYNNFKYDEDFYKTVDRGNMVVEDIVKPLTPNIGFIDDSATKYMHDCDYKEIKLI